MLFTVSVVHITTCSKHNQGLSVWCDRVD